jgi:hypothetical protein
VQIGHGIVPSWMDVGAQVNTDRFLLVRLCPPNRRRKMKDQLFLKKPGCSLQKFGVNLLKQTKPSNIKVEPILRCDNRDRVVPVGNLIRLASEAESRNVSGL